MTQSNLALTPSIAVINGKPTTLSTDVARHFGKQHNNVLRDIDNLRAQLDADHALNFEQTVETRENPSGGSPIESRAYRLTRDGFTLLAMGFTGKKALAFKLSYIDAFNKMEAALQQAAHDPEKVTLARRAALIATSEVYQSVFDAVMQAKDWQLNRYMLSFDVEQEGTVARTRQIERNACVLPISRFHDAIEDSITVDADTLTRLASVCTARLGRMAQRAATAIGA